MGLEIVTNYCSAKGKKMKLYHSITAEYVTHGYSKKILIRSNVNPVESVLVDADGPVPWEKEIEAILPRGVKVFHCALLSNDKVVYLIDPKHFEALCSVFKSF